VTFTWGGFARSLVPPASTDNVTSKRLDLTTAFLACRKPPFPVSVLAQRLTNQPLTREELGAIRRHTPERRRRHSSFPSSPLCYKSGSNIPNRTHDRPRAIGPDMDVAKNMIISLCAVQRSCTVTSTSFAGAKGLHSTNPLDRMP